MPGADETLIDRLEENIFLMDQLTTILDEDGAEALFGQVLRGMDYTLMETCPVEYRCGCSRERVAEALRCLSAAEIEEIAADGQEVEVGCDFCGTRYRFTPQQLAALKSAPAETP